MNNLMTHVRELQCISRELLYLGNDGTPVYADRFRQLNTEVFHLAENLFHAKSDTDEEEASLCLALLTAYSAVIYSTGNKEDKIQVLLDRSFNILGNLPASLLKCQLLTICYGEVFDEELAHEAHTIIDTWKGRSLSEEEEEIVQLLGLAEDSLGIYQR